MRISSVPNLLSASSGEGSYSVKVAELKIMLDHLLHSNTRYNRTSIGHDLKMMLEGKLG